jgi:hypothetical protein
VLFRDRTAAAVDYPIEPACHHRGGHVVVHVQQMSGCWPFHASRALALGIKIEQAYAAEDVVHVNMEDDSRTSGLFLQTKATCSEKNGSCRNPILTKVLLQNSITSSMAT